MDEIWVPIPDYEGCYEVSNFGRIRALERKVDGCWGCKIRRNPQLMKTCPKKNKGYQTIKLRKDGRKKTFNVHRIVMAAFIGKSKLQVDHIDGNPSNNRLDNLRYCTRAENAANPITRERNRATLQALCERMRNIVKERRLARIALKQG